MFYEFCIRLAYVLLHVLYRIEVKGRENLQKCEGTRFIICPNHVHIFDPAFVAITRVGRKGLLIMAKAELFKNRFASAVLRGVGALPVERGKGDTGTIDYMKNELIAGRPLLLFPEGTRGDDDKMLPLKSGAFFIAESTKATILPCHIKYQKRKGIRAFGKVRLVFGEPMTAKDMGLSLENKATIRAAKKELTARIQRLSEV